MLVVSDTTPLIALMKAGKIEILKSLYGHVLIPGAVYDELTANADFQAEAEFIKNCDFIECLAVSNRQSVAILQQATGLDAGESESIVLYGERNADLLLIDERRGRKVANRLDIKLTGTLGLLLLALEASLLSAAEVNDSIDLMIDSELRFSKELLALVRSKASR